MSPISKVQWVEIVLLAPGTYIVVSILPFGFAVTTTTLLTSVVAGRWRESGTVALLSLYMFVAGLGLFGLWFVVLTGPDWILARPRWRAVVMSSLLAGLAAVACWLVRLDEPAALLAWALVLVAPSILGLRYLWILATRQRGT